VGRPHWKKGYDYALKACAKLDQQGIDFKYTIIGAAGDEELLFLIDDLGLQDHVTLTDKLPQAKVFELMKVSDLFLLPSLEEGIANVAVEAMALGTPVISTNCGGMQELITHNEEGWIVPIRDEEAIAQTIQKFIALEESTIKNFKFAARQKVETQHSENLMVEGMLRLYSRVVG
jgi:colanic acid/amylovoran biosynthesis glycosyltransferase